MRLLFDENLAPRLVGLVVGQLLSTPYATIFVTEDTDFHRPRIIEQTFRSVRMARESQ